ncbi:MAG: ABC transporter substrate-binding protein [Lachnospiraceae bacterium]|nr:ABC transporter substrate-binding protein [Lachnospiraceae bacterium]
MKKRKATVFLAAVLGVAVAAAGCGSNTGTTTAAPTSAAAQETTAPAASSEPIRIGGIFNVTGDQSSIDAPAQKGFDLAVDLINKAGGINGRLIEATSYDGQTDQAVCANNAKKLIEQDKVIAIGGLSDSDYAYAAGAVAQAAGIPIVFSGATTPDIPDTVGNYAFLTAFGDNTCAYATANFLFKTQGAKTVYVLIDDSMSYTTNLASYFIEHWKELGGEVVLEDHFKSGDYDFSAQIQRYLATGETDAMFISSGPDDASSIIQQFREGGATAPMISGDGWDSDLWGVAGDLANQDIYVGTHYATSDESDVVQNFIKAYNEKYGIDPENAFAALGYDCMMVLKKAIEDCGGDVTSANIRDKIEAIQGLQCVTGTISYSAESHVPAKSVVITKAEDNHLVFVENAASN